MRIFIVRTHSLAMRPMLMLVYTFHTGCDIDPSFDVTLHGGRVSYRQYIKLQLYRGFGVTAVKGWLTMSGCSDR